MWDHLVQFVEEIEKEWKSNRGIQILDWKTFVFASLYLRAIINIFIQVIFPSIMAYLDRTFKEEKNHMNFK